MICDPQNGYPHIQWPADFRPENADLFAYGEIDIHAPIEIVWHHIVTATEWPKWYPHIQNVKIQNSAAGRLEERAVILWTAYGVPLESPVIEFDLYSRISWISCRPGYTPEWYQTWGLVSLEDKCRVSMGKVGRGPNAVARRDSGDNALHTHHDLWLKALKRRAEA